jgi:hypothetical protein
MTLSRPVATSAPNTGRNLNYCLPRVRAHTPNTPAHSTCPAYLGLFIQTTSGTATGLAGVGNLVLPLDCRGLRRLAPAVPNFDLTQRHEPGSQARRQVTDLSPVVGMASLHVGKHGGVYGQEVGAGFQGCGNAN